MKSHTAAARAWALSQDPRPSVEAERAYAEGLARAQASDPASVLPMSFDDGSSMIVGMMSGGADYVDGMPRRLTLEFHRTRGKPILRDYVQVATKSGRTRSRGKRPR